MQSDPSSSGARDAELMLRIRDGDDAAFVALVERWRLPLARYFAFAGARAGAVDDLLQEVFLRVFRARRRFRPRHVRSFRAWILRIAHNVFVDSLRRLERRRAIGDDSPDPRSVDRVACPRQPTGARRDDLLDLEAAVGRLPIKMREVIVLSLEEGLAYSEIARVLGIPVGTVKSRMHHAVRRLSGALDVEATR